MAGVATRSSNLSDCPGNDVNEVPEVTHATATRAAGPCELEAVAQARVL